MNPISNCCGAEMHWNDLLAERCPQCHENCVADEDHMYNKFLTVNGI